MADASPDVRTPEVANPALDSMLKDYGKEIGAVEGRVKERDEKIGSLIGEVQQGRKEASALEFPVLKELPKKPDTPTHDPIQSMGSAAMMMAIFGSALTKRPLVNALNSGAAVMKAYQQQDVYNAKLAMEEWRINLDNAVTLHNFQKDAYEAAIKKINTNQSGAIAEIQTLAAQNKDEPMLLQARKGNIEGIIDLAQKRDAAFSQMEKDRPAIEKQALLNNAVIGLTQARESGDPEAVKKAEQHLKDVQAGFYPSVAAANSRTPSDRVSAAFKIFQTENPKGDDETNDQYFDRASKWVGIILGTDPETKAALETLKGDIKKQIAATPKDKVSQQWTTYKAANPSATWEDFEKAYRRINGVKTAEDNAALQAAKDEAAMQRTIVNNQTKLDIAATPKDQITQLWKTYKQENPEATFEQFEKDYRDIKGVSTAEEKKALQEAKDEAALARENVKQTGQYDRETLRLTEANRHNQAIEKINALKTDNQAEKDRLRQEEMTRHNQAVEGLTKAKTDAQLSMFGQKQTEIERHNAAMEDLGNNKYLSSKMLSELRLQETNRHNMTMEGISQQRADNAGQSMTLQKGKAVDELLEKEPGITRAEAIRKVEQGAKGGSYTPAASVVVDDGGKEKTVLAQQDKFTGQWVSADEKHQPVGEVKKIVKGNELSPDDPSVKDVAKLISEYHQAPLSSFALKSPWGQAVMAEVGRQNPNYNATIYQARQKAERDFATGTQGNTVRSFNVTISHLDTLQELADALNNGDVPAINRLSNKVAEETGSPAPTSFDAAKAIVGQELVKAIVASGGGVTERQEAGQRLSSAYTPEQLRGVIETYQKLMAGQLKGLQKQYEVSTGEKNFDTYLSPESKAVLDKLGKDDGIAALAKQAWGSYDPTHYNYRINPETGKPQRSRKN